MNAIMPVRFIARKITAHSFHKVDQTMLESDPLYCKVRGDHQEFYESASLGTYPIPHSLHIH